MQKSNSVFCFYCDIEALGGSYFSWILVDNLEKLVSWEDWRFFGAYNNQKIKSLFKKQLSHPFIRIHDSIKDAKPGAWGSITGIALIPVYAHKNKRFVYTNHLPLRKELYINFLGLSENEIPKKILLKDFCELCILYRKYN